MGNAVMVPASAPLLALVALVVAGAAGLTAAVAGRGSAALLAAVTLPALVAGAARGAAAVHVPGPGTVDYYTGRAVTVTGTVARAGGSAAFESFWLSDLRLSRAGPVAGTLQVTARSAGFFAPGARLRATGVLDRLPARAVDGSTGFDDRMERQGVLGTIASASVTPLAPAPPFAPQAMAGRARIAVASAVRARVPEPEATILAGELLGIRGKLPGTAEQDLVSTGLVHLLAVSGLKVALVGGTLAALLRNVRRELALLAVLAMFAYAEVGGGGPGAMRATAMSSLALVAATLRRDSDSPRALLLVAAVMLGLSPGLAGDAGFQYSFLGVAGIQAGQRVVRRALAFLPRLLGDALSVSLAAQVATLPLTAAHFHVIPVLGPLANVAFVPMLTPTMAVAGWLGAGLPDPFGAMAAGGAGAARLLLLSASVLTRLPAGVLVVPWFRPAHAVACYVGALGAAAALGGARRIRRGRSWSLRVRAPLAVPVAGVLLAGGSALALGRPDGRLHAAFLDTPGAGAVLTAPDGARMLVDTSTSAPSLATALEEQLAPGDAPPELLVLTSAGHASTGGVGGIRNRAPGLVVIPRDAAGESAAAAGAVFARHGSSVVPVTVGDRLDWHGVTLDVTGCGEEIGILLRYRRRALWLCDAAGTGEVAEPPPVALDVADLGAGGAVPLQPLPGLPWVVIHGTRGGRGELAPAVLGPRLWRTGKDGPLEVSCDDAGCRRAWSP